MPLLVGTLLAVASLCFVLWPLFRGDAALVPNRVTARPQSPAVDALRDLEFDHETGKVSDQDYGVLKARYTEQALAVIRAGDRSVCAGCGPRPETDAHFCSSCCAPLLS
ncbi:MAG: hypothetical protein ACR2HE_08115 [Casimicrobiaceae bacterium]